MICIHIFFLGWGKFYGVARIFRGKWWRKLLGDGREEIFKQWEEILIFVLDILIELNFWREKKQITVTV